MSDNAHKESTRRKRQAVAYTTHYRSILSVISSFPIDYYGIKKGSYVSPDPGQHCDPSTVYPIPTGDLLEYGKTHPEALRGTEVPDDNTPVNDISDVWKEYQKKQEEDHRRCSLAALEDQQFTTARANAEYNDWPNKIKEKNAVKLSPCDKVNKAVSSSHDGLDLIDLSEKKGSASSSKKDSPTCHAAKWHQTDSHKKVNIKEDTTKADVVIGGLPLKHIKTKGSPSLPEDDDRPALGFEPIKSEPIEPAPYEMSAIRDKMSANEQISLITDFVNLNADKDDPKSKAFMQKML